LDSSELTFRYTLAMNIIGIAMFVYVPLGVLVAAMSFWAGMAVARGLSIPVAYVKLGRMLALILGCVGIALFPILAGGKWMYLFWSSQVPMGALFLASGMLRVSASDWNAELELDERSNRTRIRKGGSCFLLAVTFLLGVLPLLMVSFLPGSYSNFRNVGLPIVELQRLAMWGFGGAMPDYLAPLERSTRSVGSLPVLLTVPFGATSIAAWMWIAYGVLAFVAKRLSNARARISFTLVSAPILGLLTASCALLGLGIGPLQAGFFLPIGRGTGIWKSHPAAMRGYGPVLACALVIGIALAWNCARRKGVDARTKDAE
jgi:hypothetical protein